MSDRDSDSIGRSDMGKFPHEVQNLVLHLVNTEKVRWRGIDKNHMLLYPPDGVSRPFKIAAVRPAADQTMFIERQFMKVYGVKGPDGTVPHSKEEEPMATRTELGVAQTEGAAEAVRALASVLGISLDGSVSEEDYLTVVAEKDACQSEYERVAGERDEADEKNKLLTATVTDLTAQRDHLLDQITRIAEITTEAQ